MGDLRWLDFLVVFVYMAAMAGVGIWFARRQTTTESYFVAKRAIPGWAMGVSLYATLISSVTFVAYPGSAYAKDWSLLIPGFMVLIVLLLVGKIIIPFYREAVGMSAYEYFGKRFGQGARMYRLLRVFSRPLLQDGLRLLPAGADDPHDDRLGRGPGHRHRRHRDHLLHGDRRPGGGHLDGTSSRASSSASGCSSAWATCCSSLPAGPRRC